MKKSHEFIVMPNHFHGILIIDPVETGRDLSLQKIKSLSQLIDSFKTRSSKYIHRSGLMQFSWQRSFYNHIIRTENALEQIRRYIQYNHLKWSEHHCSHKKFQMTNAKLQIKSEYKIPKT